MLLYFLLNFIFSFWFVISLWFYYMYHQNKMYLNEMKERDSLKDLIEEEMKYNEQDFLKPSYKFNKDIDEKHIKLLNKKEDRIDKILQTKKDE